MPHPLHVVDVFAEARWAGNPLSVVLDAGDLSGDQMQAIAREQNHSETTFVTASAPRDGAWPVRIFTPTTELPFAGHPTLGTAWVIRRHLTDDAPAGVTLDLPVGPVPVAFESDDQGELAWLLAPEVALGRTWDAEAAAAAAGLDAGDLHAELPAQTASVGISLIVVPVKGLDALQRARLNLEAARAIGEGAAPLCVYLVCLEAEAPDNDLQVRMLFDADGPREDPATGSAASCLGRYLLEHRPLGDGPLDLRVEQGAVVQRPSLLRVRARNIDTGVEIAVGGAVVPAVEGRLL
jgi:trans-2,3-dihydro-3-hydroxyanthranilate isomerase